MGKRGSRTPTAAAKANSVRTLASALHVSKKTAENLIREGLPRDANGNYDLNAAQRLREERANRLKGGGIRTRTTVLLDEKLKEVKLLEAKIDLNAKIGKLVSREEVRREWEQGLLTIRNAMMSLGRELAPRLVGKNPREIQAVIDTRVFEILRSLAHPEYAPNGHRDRTTASA